MDFRITCDGNPQDIQDIKQQLAAYNQSRCPDVPSLPLGIFYEDEAGRKLAGITGDSSGDWLCIDFLFVSEALRGQGRQVLPVLRHGRQKALQHKVRMVHKALS